MTLTAPLALRASAVQTAVTTEYGIYEALRTSGTATATTSNKLVASAGSFVTNAVVVGDIVKNTTSGKFAVVTAIDSATTLSLSADIFSSTNTYEIYPGLGYKLQQGWGNLTVILDVTAAATDAGDTLDVYIDTSFDGGVSWVNIGHFNQVLGNGGAKKYAMAFKNDNPGTSVIDVSSNASAGAIRQIGFGDRIRHRATLADASTVNASFTYSIQAFLK